MASLCTTLENINDLLVQRIHNCRICLQECSEEPYCLCRGDLKVHEACLLQFLKRKLRGPDFGKCEICTQSYKLVEYVEYRCACNKLCSKVRDSIGRFVCEIIIAVVTAAYLSFFGWNSTHISLKQEVTLTATTIIAVCAVILLLTTLVVWFREFAIDVVQEIRNVRPWNEPEPDPAILNRRRNQVINVGD